MGLAAARGPFIVGQENCDLASHSCVKREDWLQAHIHDAVAWDRHSLYLALLGPQPAFGPGSEPPEASHWSWKKSADSDGHWRKSG